MRSETVAVGCHRLRIRLFERLSGPSHVRPVATGCARWAPINAPYRRALRTRADHRRPAIVSSRLRLAGAVTRESRIWPRIGDGLGCRLEVRDEVGSNGG